MRSRKPEPRAKQEPESRAMQEQLPKNAVAVQEFMPQDALKLPQPLLFIEHPKSLRSATPNCKTESSAFRAKLDLDNGLAKHVKSADE